MMVVVEVVVMVTKFVAVCDALMLFSNSKKHIQLLTANLTSVSGTTSKTASRSLKFSLINSLQNNLVIDGGDELSGGGAFRRRRQDRFGCAIGNFFGFEPV